MEIPDLIMPAVWEKATASFANHENWVAYNNTLLFVHETDIHFFTNQDDAEDFAFDNGNDGEHWHVVRIADLEDLKNKVEAIVPGLVYAPVVQEAMVAEDGLRHFPKDQLIKKSKIMLNEESLNKNYEYLKNQLMFLGFDESLNQPLLEKMKEGKSEFTLDSAREFDKDKMEAVIHFRHSMKDGKEAYFCNHYISTLLREDQNRSQFIYVNNKGQSMTFKESRNLLNSRSVYKEITPKEGSPYKAWFKIDHENMDPKTGYPKLRPFHTNYGFDVKEALGRMEFKGMKYDDQLKSMLKTLQKGNLAPAVLIKNGAEVPVFIEANPQQRTLNMYDKTGEKMYYPMKQVEQKYGQAPVDAAKSNGVSKATSDTSVLNEPPGKYEKKDLLAKNKPSNGLLEKTRTRGNGKKLKH
ncbi:MAG: hypothetical protein V4557_12885 [Bacteroidota bacterium]